MRDPIQPGIGCFVFPDRAAPVDGAVRVFYSCPTSGVSDAPIIIAMHGRDRAAEALRGALAQCAFRTAPVILAPEFDFRQFPDAYAYNFGGARYPPPNDLFLPRSEWNFGLIDRLFHCVRRSARSNRTTFGFFGISAGAQYVMRYLALSEAISVNTAVAANSGAYMMPDLQCSYPDGMGGLDLDERHVERYFGRSITILLGDADTDTMAPDLPRSDFAMAQGLHRLARGQWYFEHCMETARGLGVPLRWKLEIESGAGHVSQSIYDRAMDVLSDI